MFYSIRPPAVTKYPEIKLGFYLNIKAMLNEKRISNMEALL